ncbi:MAG: radical SAM protein [Deltaproteobacteria bacterium]|nr:radical SAM protein [Deltaproteobacteria bacterium]
MPIINPICHGMWSLTPYDKCDFRCVYCCTRVQGTSRPIVPVDAFDAALRRELDAIPLDDLLIVGAFCDAYPPLEERLGLTRRVIALLIAAGRKFDVVTKATTILRDLPLFDGWAHDRKIYLSIASTDAAALRQLDPGAPSPTQRFAVLHTLHRAGLGVAVNVLPWIPDVSDTATLIERTPADVDMVFAPLQFGSERDGMNLLGRRFTRPEVVERYLADYRRYGHVANTSWVKPTPPPIENDPLYRLPVLPPPGRWPLLARLGRGVRAAFASH